MSAPTVIADPERLTLQLEVAKLRAQLAESQKQYIELAVGAGELHARVEALLDELARVRADRDAWRRSALHSPAAALAAGAG